MCGRSFVNTNVKIVGGVQAASGSWPSIAYISWNYKTIYNISGESFYLYGYIISAGTLIDSRKIVTDGYAIPTSIPFTYKNVSYEAELVVNEFYPTLASMVSVFLGVQNKSSLSNNGNYQAPIFKATFLEFRKVNLIILIADS